MTPLSTVLIVLGLSLPAVAAGSEPPGNPDDPEVNFEYVWRSIDRTYGQFSVKDVDWDMLYRMYRPQVTATTTNEELWDILVTMLGTLNDAHVCLADGKRRICGGSTEEFTHAKDFSLDLIKTKYLHGTSSAAREGTYTSGWLTDQIGYLHIADFKRDREPHTQAIDSFLGEFASARALVIDVRDNPGGSGRNHEIVANRFADRRRQYMQSQTRYGPKHDDLLPPEYRTVEPDGPTQFTRPIVLLAHRHTASGPEGFTLAMRVLPHVTVVGDLTEGALSSQFPDRLPNGWTLFVAFKVTRDHEGLCWDGIGIPPDLRVLNTPAEIAAGTDRQLEFAQRLLERGAPEPQDEAASFKAVKTSLVDEYARSLRGEPAEAAIAALNRARGAVADTAFFSVDEAMQLADRFLASRQYPAAIGLLRACREEVPELAAVYAMLAKAYVGAGDVASAEAALAQGHSVEPMFPWEAAQIERARLDVRKTRLGSAARMIGQTLADGGSPAAESKFQELLAQRDTGPVFDEADFNALGYELLQAGNLESAIYMFEKGVQLFPDSWNAFDSLGEALLQAGQRDRAISSYRKSVELNPRNASGQETLKRLEAGQ